VCKGRREEAGKPDFLNWTESCNVYRCIMKRKLDFCYQRSGFPCAHLQPYADRGIVSASQYKSFQPVFNKKRAWNRGQRQKPEMWAINILRKSSGCNRVLAISNMKLYRDYPGESRKRSWA